MRILAITNLYPNPYHPTRATFNRDQFRQLAALHPMAVISPIAWTDELTARWKGDGPLPAQRQVMRDGMTVCHPRYLFPPRVMRGMYGELFQRCVRPSFEQMLASFRPDIILGSWAYPDGWAALELGRRAGLPVVIKVHGSDVLTQTNFPARQRKMMETLRAADGVIAVSRDLSERMIGFGVRRERIRIVYSGVDTSRFYPGPKAEARARLGLDALDAGMSLFLYVGNFFHVKGADVLVDACGKLAGSGARFICQMIGQGPLRNDVERQIASLGLQQRVILAGAKPHTALPDWFRAADALVLPSRSEGVPNVLLEAAACGTPFIASRVGGVPEISHLGRGELIPAGDATALAGAMKRVLGSSNEVASHVQQFRSHSDAAGEIADFLLQVADQTRHLPTIAA